LKAISLDIYKKTEQESRKVETAQQVHIFSKNFSFLSLYSFMYCIMILVLIGFEFDLHAFPYSHALFCFNCFSVVSLVLLLGHDELLRYTSLGDRLSRWIEKVLRPDYYKIVWLFMLSVIVIVGIYWIMFPNAVENNKKIPPDYYDYFFINRIACLLIPAFHFVYYFIKVSILILLRTWGVSKQLKKIRLECENFAKTLETTFDAVENLTIQYDGKNIHHIAEDECQKDGKYYCMKHSQIVKQMNKGEKFGKCTECVKTDEITIWQMVLP